MKKCKVILLESPTGVLILGQYIQWNIIGTKGTKHHLYFVSDDEIQVGDWVLGAIGFKNIPQQYIDAFTPFNKGHCFKIIASTDPSLNLPLISEHFIVAYMEKGGIDEVLVEFNGDNIIVFPVKDTWTREEVIALCAKAHGHGYDLCLGTTDDKLEFKDWIKNQL